jgi:hypothetical protein
MSSPRPSSKADRKVTEIPVGSRRIEETVGALRQLLEDDEQEQRETFFFLKQALDEDRSSERRIFAMS